MPELLGLDYQSWEMKELKKDQERNGSEKGSDFSMNDKQLPSSGEKLSNKKNDQGYQNAALEP